MEQIMSRSLASIGVAFALFTGSLVHQNVALAAAKKVQKVQRVQKNQNPVIVATHQVIGELKAAHKYLEAANHDYQGHRAKASHEITQAIHQLEKHHHAHHKTPLNVTVAHPHPKHHHHLKGITEPQALSDAQVRIAGNIVAGALQQLSSLPQDKHTIQAEKDLQAAQVQIATALRVSPKK